MPPRIRTLLGFPANKVSEKTIAFLPVTHIFSFCKKRSCVVVCLFVCFMWRPNVPKLPFLWNVTATAYVGLVTGFALHNGYRCFCLRYKQPYLYYTETTTSQRIASLCISTAFGMFAGCIVAASSPLWIWGVVARHCLAAYSNQP